jgi:putative ABC transport system permease protein
MSGLSLSYAARNLVARRLTTLLTAAGMALVVFVFATVLMMGEGLRQTLATTGSPGNLVILRDGAQTEVQSAVERNQASLLETLPGIATDAAGQPMLAREAVILVNLPKVDSQASANVVVRGADAISLALRPQISLREGRAFRANSTEIMVGAALASGLGLRPGSTLRFGLTDWTVTGIFNAENSGFESEIWADREQIMQVFRRPSYSSALVGLRDPGARAEFAAALAADSRLNLRAQRETEYYAAQSRTLSTFIGVLGKTITAVFSIGAIIGAAITMYASVASRTREIGTLRALGFKRASIVRAFLQEAMLLGLAAGLAGLAGASAMQWVEISTTNFQTFSEIVFNLVLTPGIAVNVLLFAVFMGVLGGVLPAFRAARLEIVDALRAS